MHMISTRQELERDAIHGDKSQSRVMTTGLRLDQLDQLDQHLVPVERYLS